MADDNIAQVELRETAGALLNEGQAGSPNGRPAPPGSHPSSTSGSVSKASPGPADCYWFAQSGDVPSESKHPFDGADSEGKENSQEKEERIRFTREKQAEERFRKLEEIKSAAIQAQKFRELQEEERRRKIEEIKAKDMERRHLVEERKKQIWEADKERRETILRKSQEREAKIEAKKNAQRSSIGFAFGSCIPRSLDLETLGIGKRSSSQGSVTTQFPASFGARSDSNDRVESEVIRRRTTSSYGLDSRNAHRHTIHETSFGDAYILGSDQRSFQSPIGYGSGSPRPFSSFDLPWGTDLDPPTPVQSRDVDMRLSGVLTGSGVMVGEDLMTQSLTSLMGATHRGRRKTDLIPTIPSSRDSPRTRSPGRAYSMTRLDQLSQPKRRQLEALREECNNTAAVASLSPSGMTKTKSMTHLAWRRGGGGPGKSGADGGRGLGSSRVSADPQMSKSTSHLAATSSSRSSPTRMSHLSGSSSPRHSARGSSPAASETGRKRLSQSMWQLSSPSSAPRPTRAFTLRREALAQIQQKGMSRSMMHLITTSSSDGDGASRARSSPSRPQSSMSQMSLSSHASQNSSVNVRTRSAPRRPRPMSVAGSAPDKRKSTSDERPSRSSEKRGPGTIDEHVVVPVTLASKPPRAKSVGADQALKDKGVLEESKPPIGTPSPMPRRLPSTASKAAMKERPKSTTKPSKQEVMSKSNLDQAPEAVADKKEEVAPIEIDVDRLEPEQPTSETSVAIPTSEEPENKPAEAPVPVEDVVSVVDEQVAEAEVTSSSEAMVEVPSEIDVEATPAAVAEVQVEQAPLAADVETPQQVPLVTSTSGPAQVGEISSAEAIPVPVKTKITTEEEAKAALAEKRRLAREQAEREAELERQRQEELRRQEEERLRREEEENRLWEQEQEAARLAEEERLRRAIEEQEKREEEERQRREEEAKQKAEKEKAEKQAREEQEKIRKETEEKLRKEEEERAKRRRRVEAIMKRTRGNNTPPVTTPTKSIEPVAILTEVKGTTTGTISTSSSVEQNFGNDRLASEQTEGVSESRQVEHEMGESAITESRETLQTVVDSRTETKMKENVVTESVHANGFSHSEILSNQVNTNFILDSSSSEKKASLFSTADLSEFDLLAPTPESTTPPKQSDVGQLIDLSLGSYHSSETSETTTVNTTRNEIEHVSNEDNVNFNITSNGVDSPFVDNYTKCQESSLTDLIS